MLKFDIIKQDGGEVRAVALTLEQPSPSYKPDLNTKVQREFLQHPVKYLQALLSYNVREINNLKCPEKIKSLDHIKQPFKDLPWWSQLLAQGLNMMGIPVDPRENSSQVSPKVELTEDHLNRACAKNPLVLFSECVADECLLNRLKHPQSRDHFQEVLVQQVRRKIQTKALRVCLHMGGYLFNELCILTELGQYYDLTVDVILDKGEYIQLVTSPDSNPLAAQKEISFKSTDALDDRREWTQVLTYRYIKFLEWFQSLGINMKLSLHDSPETFIQSKRTVDLYMGIDYVDQDLLQAIPFILTSLSTTRAGGLIASLRTDGLLSRSTKMTILECPSEIKLPEELDNELAKELEKETLIRNGTDVFDCPPELTENGITYSWNHAVLLGPDKCLLVYTTPRGNELRKLIQRQTEKQQLDIFKYWDELPALVFEWEVERQ